MKLLTESGLLRHDLDYLVLPLIDIDTFESKIDNARAIVVAFYVFEQEPAKDLEIFIEKGSIPVLDTETSPAPTEDGYYVVFVEMNRNAEFPEQLVEIIESVDNLTNLDQWQFKTFGDDEIYDLTTENLVEHVNLDPSTVSPAADDVEDEIDDIKAEKEPEDEGSEEEPVAESIVKILRNGLMETFVIQDDQLYLTGPGIAKAYKIIAISESEPSIPVAGLEIGNPLINESVQLGKLLGLNYSVDAVDNGLLVSSDFGYLLLEPLD